MFKTQIESSIDRLRDKLNFDSCRFTEEAKDALSEIEGAQIVAYYSSDININDDGCGGGFANVNVDIILLIPATYDVDNTIMNVYSFFDHEILSVSTDSKKIYSEIYKDNITSDYKLIRFRTEFITRVMKSNCCLEMEELC